MSWTSPQFEPSRSGTWFAILLAVTAVAFWPSYLSLPFSNNSTYTHFHAVTATLWMLMLVAQPWAIRTRRLAWHRALGKASYVLVPVIVLSVVLLAHNRLALAAPEAWPIQTYILYLQLSLAVMFMLCWALAIRFRREMPVHARFMICTGLTLIDPILIRIMFWVDPTPAWNYQWATFGATDAVLLVLIWLERGSARGRWVFPLMLSLFVLSQLPALAGWTSHAGWQAFARWFQHLSLT